MSKKPESKKNKRRARKKTPPQPITINLERDQLKQAADDIKAHGIALFAIQDAEGTIAACTTSTVHN